ncbi:hypothetical protein MUK42_33201 [Musa troglodytarum]|uniref:Uncharacterized protein n=1 Tax=Musa troglodytarum TaxID=320322 RepID=A0A9E7IAY0_9LILI|nr:hypothetical protein MUK42_33201 [Musa troglodytarum]
MDGLRYVFYAILNNGRCPINDALPGSDSPPRAVEPTGGTHLINPRNPAPKVKWIRLSSIQEYGNPPPKDRK